MGGSTECIEWAYTQRTSRLLRVLVYISFAMAGGLFALGVGLVGLLALDALASGDLERLAVVVVGTIFVGFFALRGPPALVFVPAERERLAREFEVSLRPRRLLVVSAIGAAVLLVSVRVAFWVAGAVFLGGMLMLVVVAVLRSEGEIDAEDLTLEHGTRELSLTALRNVRVVTLGSLALCWLSFERGSVGARAPRFVVVPHETYRRGYPIFERAIESPSDAGRTAPLTERAVFLVFGMGLCAVGPVFWMLTSADPDAGPIVLYAGALMGVFGLLFVWFAVVN